MKVIECKGNHLKIGECAGEGLREEIRRHIDKSLDRDLSVYWEDIKNFKSSTGRYLPHLLLQMKGMARGAGVSEEEILALNLPGGQAVVDDHLRECSNIVFGGGPDGPLWGKNNDGSFDERPVCILKIYPEEGIPVMCCTFCGFVATGDIMNAEGLAAGHSSVGSKFRQSPRNVSARLWIYEGMFKSGKTRDFAVHLTSMPLYGKGFSMVAVDSDGRMCSAEIACPLVQLRWPEKGEKAMNCVNCFQLPQLKDYTNRTPERLANARGRKTFLEKAPASEVPGLRVVKNILRYHGDYSVCRHGGKDLSHTTYSLIGLSCEGKVLFREGYACGGEYEEVAL